MKTIVRDAEAQDIPDVRKMIQALAAHHGDEADLTQDDLASLCFGPRAMLTLLVAVRGGTLVGYAALETRVQLQFALRIMDVQHLYVSETARRHGVGRDLIEAARTKARAANFQIMTLGVMADNMKALAFYEALGFERRAARGSLKMRCRL